MFDDTKLSIVLCSYNEQQAIEPVIHRIFAATQSLLNRVEVIVVDDSNDDTPNIVRTLMGEYPGLKLIHREKSQRNGLGGAILTGLLFAKETNPNGRHIGMSLDSDGQHPPELIPEMLSLILEEGYNFVSPSRYTVEGSAEGLDGPLRLIMSWAFRQIPRFMFPRKMWGLHDVLGNFFMFDFSLVNFDRLQAQSARFQPEILANARARDIRAVEIPFTFAKRLGGESKMSIKEGLRFFRHMLSLRLRTLFRR